MRRLAAFTVLLALLSLPILAGAWTVEDCEEVNYDHPDCDQYPTTTYQTTTTVEVTTTTEQETTTTQPETTTTVEVQETTTTTAAACAEGLIHQPPLCVSPTTTLAPTETVPAPTTPAGEETLPFTSGGETGMFALAALAFAALGFGMVRRGRTG